MKSKLNFGFISLIQTATLKLKRVIPPFSEAIATLQTTADEEKKKKHFHPKWSNPGFGGVSKDNFHSEESFYFQMLGNIWDLSPE
jgi:hypothetical protein